MSAKTKWFMRKYEVENNKPKPICQIYRMELYQNQKNNQNNQHEEKQPVPGQNQNPTKTSSQPIRVSKHLNHSHVPIWAEFNQRQQFGYAVQPTSPLVCFNNQQYFYQNSEIFYQTQQKNYTNHNSWEQNDD